jgi:hypothetical protein
MNPPLLDRGRPELVPGDRQSGFILGRVLVLTIAGLMFHCFKAPTLQAQTLPIETASSAIDLSSKLIPPATHESEPCTTDCVFFTDDDVSQTEFTQPSLWWSVRELGERLIPDWIVYPTAHRVDFTIDPQRWNWMNYFERYTLMTQLAYVLRPNGYDFRIFDPQQPDTPIASYTCEFAMTPPTCQVQFMN